MGSNWRELGKLMGKSADWARSTWELILKRENVPTGSDLNFHVSILIGKLATEIKSKSSKKLTITEELKNSSRPTLEGRTELERDRNTQMGTTDLDLEIDSLGCLSERRETHSVQTTRINMSTHEGRSVLQGEKGK
eukprot:TRINITY_DN2524_c0_g7_i1.p2 TRINITY_DN2524_c0_g7~~TRINITY_DN2524_c0_g7_i1.p2  ORF type:complete len:136 (+),score=10.16 TRINITY_DN2524_c0_g7_i1:949-1356(+)